MIYQYKMSQIPVNFALQDANCESPLPATRLEKLVNDYAKQGWEFYRIDTINVSVKRGCLGSLLRRPAETAPYCLVTFRKEQKITALPKPEAGASLPFPSLDAITDESEDWPSL